MRDVEYAKAWLILTEIGVEMQTFVNPSHEDNVMYSPCGERGRVVKQFLLFKVHM